MDYHTLVSLYDAHSDAVSELEHACEHFNQAVIDMHSYDISLISTAEQLRELENLAAQIEDDLCIAPSSIHEVLIFPLSLVQPARIIEIVRDVNRTGNLSVSTPTKV